MNQAAICTAAVGQSSTIDLPSPASGASLRILLAESEPELRRILALALRAEGHWVLEAADGGEMLEAIAALILDGDRQHFDLVVAEQDIPGIPGSAVLAGLRSRGRDTPFILLTDNATIAARARRLGAMVVERPSDVEAIQGAVRLGGAAAQVR